MKQQLEKSGYKRLEENPSLETLKKNFKEAKKKKKDKKAKKA